MKDKEMREQYERILSELKESSITLVAVSKKKPSEAILNLYEWGHRDFGENRVQELIEKAEQLPKDIHWHMIGHLQRNKVKYIAPFVHLIHSVDTQKLLKEIDKQAANNDRVIPVLLQIHIAKEEAKFGLDEQELFDLLNERQLYPNVEIRGLMGMATFTSDEAMVRKEFRYLRSLFDKITQEYTDLADQFKVCSMGMSGDYQIAIEEGSTMVRIGSAIFGARE